MLFAVDSNADSQSTWARRYNLRLHGQRKYIQETGKWASETLSGANISNLR